MPARPLFLLLCAMLAGCAAPAVNVPSLAPRAAEAIDPRVVVVPAAASAIADAALLSRLAELVAAARAGDGAFRAAADEAERLAAAAGPAPDESWVVAQAALSAAVAARAPITRALGDVDALGADRIVRSGGLAPADMAALSQAAADVAAIDRRQAMVIDRLQARLAR